MKFGFLSPLTPSLSPDGEREKVGGISNILGRSEILDSSICYLPSAYALCSLLS